MSRRRHVAARKKDATAKGPARGARAAASHGRAGGRRKYWIAGGVAVVAVFAALLAVSAQRTSSPDASVASAGGAGGRVSPMSLTTIDGDVVSFPARRPGALFFTVSNCLTCIPSAQALAELKRRLGSRIDVLLVSLDPADPPAALRDQRGLIGDPPYPSAIDSTGTLANRYAITALGTAVIYDSDGKIVDQMVDPGMDALSSAFGEAGVS